MRMITGFGEALTDDALSSLLVMATGISVLFPQLSTRCARAVEVGTCDHRSEQLVSQ